MSESGWSFHANNHLVGKSINCVKLPSIRDVLLCSGLDKQIMNRNRPTVDTITCIHGASANYSGLSYHRPNEVSYQVDYVSSDKRENEINLLKKRVRNMEGLVEKQAQLILNLEDDNKRRRMKLNETVHSMVEPKPKKKKVSVSQQSSSVKFISSSDPVVKDQSTINREEPILANMEDYTVTWKGETFVLIDAFNKRNKIMNYYIPLYQSQFPDRVCKLVLSSDEYKQLFKENSHRCESERKHAWRISIFSVDFYEFVKNQL